MSMLMSQRDTHNYPDDIFADSRMSFGDHIEELRSRLVKALLGLGICLGLGFAVDLIGLALGNDNIGVGRPMVHVITQPVEDQVRAFYARRNERVKKRLDELTTEVTSPERAKLLWAKYMEEGYASLSKSELHELQAAPVSERIFLREKGSDEYIEYEKLSYPAFANYNSNLGELLMQNHSYMKTLSVQEPMIVWIKVSLLCGVVIASPVIFYQLWMFLAAGLYPHERGMVYQYLFPSITLFISGVMLCQFVVIPGAVKALLAFNDWVDTEPDLRLNEWLSFALLLPVIFGLSFQTPLVMFFLNRIGIFGWEDYMRRWRHAFMLLGVMSAILTPTPDAITMLYLFVPMFGLYMLGVAVCKYYPPSHEQYDEDDEQVAV